MIIQLRAAIVERIQNVKRHTKLKFIYHWYYHTLSIFGFNSIGNDVTWYNLVKWSLTLHRGSYMSAQVLLNLLNEYGEKR